MNFFASPTSPYYAEDRRQLLDLIPGSNLKVLEVGCGAGNNLAYLKKRGTARYVCGVELRCDVAALARTNLLIDSILTGDFLSLDIEKLDSPFDVIIVSHVLEHFPDPAFVLAKLKPLMSNSGLLLGAVPNVRHFSVWSKLIICGEWTYQASGILDHTHLRFFTRKSLISFMAASGFNVDSIRLESAGWKMTILRRLGLGLLDEFFCYAINFIASPSRSK